MNTKSNFTIRWNGKRYSKSFMARTNKRATTEQTGCKLRNVDEKGESYVNEAIYEL